MINPLTTNDNLLGNRHMYIQLCRNVKKISNTISICISRVPCRKLLLSYTENCYYHIMFTLFSQVKVCDPLLISLSSCVAFAFKCNKMKKKLHSVVEVLFTTCISLTALYSGSRRVEFVLHIMSYQTLI